MYGARALTVGLLGAQHRALQTLCCAPNDPALTSNPGTPNPAQHRHSNGRKSAQGSGVNPGSGAVLVTGASRAARASAAGESSHEEDHRVTLPSSTLFAHCRSPGPSGSPESCPDGIQRKGEEMRRDGGDGSAFPMPRHCHRCLACWECTANLSLSRSLAFSALSRSCSLSRSLTRSSLASSRPGPVHRLSRQESPGPSSVNRDTAGVPRMFPDDGLAITSLQVTLYCLPVPEPHQRMDGGTARAQPKTRRRTAQAARARGA